MMEQSQNEGMQWKVIYIEEGGHQRTGRRESLQEVGKNRS